MAADPKGRRITDADRRWQLEPSSEDDDEYRSEFQRDRDRILYSSAFRRLAGVTQVAAVREQALLHNRLTHSIKVAQIGRSMAQNLLRDKGFVTGLQLRNRDQLPLIVETAGLAHDLGHPPFGHIAEGVLAKEMEGYGGFEGNAQSFRIVTKLAVRRASSRGLDLTRASLNGILKYPSFKNEKQTKFEWFDRSRGKKWGAYVSETTDFRHARARSERPDHPTHIRSVAAIIMDWADDISFATHDIEDYWRAGLIPLHELRNVKESDPFVQFVHERSGKEIPLADIVETYNRALLGGELPMSKFEDDYSSRVKLNQFTAKFIRTLVRAVRVRPDKKSPFVEVDRDAQVLVEVLKGLTWYHVIEKPALRVAQEGQKRIVVTLFESLAQLLERYAPGIAIEANKRVPVPVLLQEIYRGLLTAGYIGTRVRVARAVCDYICTLTEDQAIDLYERITGHAVARSSIFGAWFH